MPHCHCYNGTLRGHCALRGHCTTRGVGYMGLTKNEKNLLNQVSKELNKASKMHKSQADRIRSLGSARRVQMIGNTDNIQFVAIEVAKLTAILLGGGLLLGVPAYMMVNNKKLKTSNKSESQKLIHAFTLQPVKTSSWWAGGSSVLIGAKDNNPKQMAAGAGLMALSSVIDPKKR